MEQQEIQERNKQMKEDIIENTEYGTVLMKYGMTQEDNLYWGHLVDFPVVAQTKEENNTLEYLKLLLEDGLKLHKLHEETLKP